MFFYQRSTHNSIHRLRPFSRLVREELPGGDCLEEQGLAEVVDAATEECNVPDSLRQVVLQCFCKLIPNLFDFFNLFRRVGLGFVLKSATITCLLRELGLEDNSTAPITSGAGALEFFSGATDQAAFQLLAEECLAIATDVDSLANIIRENLTDIENLGSGPDEATRSFFRGRFPRPFVLPFKRPRPSAESLATEPAASRTVYLGCLQRVVMVGCSDLNDEVEI